MMGFPGGSDGKETTCSTGDLGSTPVLGISAIGGHVNPHQYSCLEKEFFFLASSNGQRSLEGYSPANGVPKSQARLTD